MRSTRSARKPMTASMIAGPTTSATTNHQPRKKPCNGASFIIPELRAITAAKNADHTLHNLYTLRGAKVRDARGRATYLDQMMERWSDRAEVLYGPHHWPTWGQARVVDLCVASIP